MGQGSTFSIELQQTSESYPVTSSLLKDPVAGSEEDSEYISLVLSIEDNLTNFRLLQVIVVERPGIQLLQAINGSMGVDLAYQ